MKLRIITLIAITTLLTCTESTAQVSLPERNPFKLTFRGGVLSNNNDQAANLSAKLEETEGWTVNTDYAAIGEAELSIDILKFRGAGMGMQISGMFSRPELIAKGPGGSHRVAMTQVEIARASLTFSFNGTDPYTMFELPYHSNKEAVLGITGMIIRTQNTELTPYATDSLNIKSIKGEFSQALGVTFGWNWRLGESSWVLGINGAVMFVINKSHLLDIEIDESSAFSSGQLEFAPRLVTAGLGYHF